MNPAQLWPLRDATKEIAALIATLHGTEQRLEELTGGEVDTVLDRDGRMFMLRRAQDQLRLSEAAKQTAILNALPAHIALLDSTGIIVSVNEAWRRFAGANMLREPSHGIGVNYLEICDTARGDGASTAKEVGAGIRSVLDGSVESFSLEYACNSPAEPRCFLLTVTPLTDDRQSGAVVTHLNVTAERQAEERLRNSETRFRQMAENIRDVFFLVDVKSNSTLYISPAYEEIWGRSCESLYAHPESWTEAVHPDDRASVYESYKKGMLAGSFEYEYRIVSPDGSIRWMESRGFPVRDDAGRTVRIAGVAEDITERKMVKDVLEKRAAELERFHRLSVGRELQMIELKQQVNELEKQAGRAPPYDLAFLRSEPVKTGPDHEQTA